MHHKALLISIIALLSLSAPSCNSCGGSSGGSGSTSTSNSNLNPNSNEGDPDISIKLGKGEAIEKVKSFLNKRGGTVIVPLPYTEYENVNKPCTQMDVDTDPNKYDAFLARCRPVGGGPGAPYGSRTVREATTKCCRDKPIMFTKLQPEWTAEYSKQTEGWEVSMEFEVDDIKKALAWTVNDKTGEVREKGMRN
jgi:hypothetical protein